jgi:hypothetical protein
MTLFLDAINHIIPMTLGIVASPSPMIAIIILLMTHRAKSNASSFLLGWYTGLIGVGLIVLIIPGLAEKSTYTPSNIAWGRFILGSVFLIISIFIAREIPRKGRQAPPPSWLPKLESFGFLQSFAFGFFFAAPNIKNSSLVAAGMTSIIHFDLRLDQELLILVIFCLIASIGVLIPPVAYLLFRGNAESVFSAMKKWLIMNRALILFLLLIIIGSLWVYQGSLILFP